MKDLYYKLLTEAQNSPSLLSDLAGLENYISESYNNRSFVELLQNADDACATNFIVDTCDDLLIVANNGREFTIQDIESLCRSAASSKMRGQSIGYRGIGFKSVVSISREVHLISGEYEVSFSRELTQQLIPIATRVPLIRIPHPIRKTIKQCTSAKISELKSKGYTTFFIFSGVNIQHIVEEYSCFKHTSLLFLNNINKLEVKLEHDVVVNVSTQDCEDSSKLIYIDSETQSTTWKLYSDGTNSIVFNVKNDRVEKLQRFDALIHAFLPSEDSSGFGFIVNGDFSTDPSRRHLIYDDDTVNIIRDVACLYLKILKSHLFNRESRQVEDVEILSPYFDIRLTHLLKKQSFENIFVEAISQTSNSDITFIKLPPSWLNTSDFCEIQKYSTGKLINHDCLNSSGITSVLKQLGCRVGDLDFVLSSISKYDIELSILGCAQIVSETIRQVLINRTPSSLLEAKIFFANNKLVSLNDIKDNKLGIDDSFLQLLYDNGIDDGDIDVYYRKLSLNHLRESSISSRTPLTKGIMRCVHKEVTDGAILDEEDVTYSSRCLMISPALKKWRTAEENTLQALNSVGYRLENVSNRNLGYDLEGVDSNGDTIYIEVKSLDYIGQKFRLTNNEFAVAQHKQEEYVLALVVQTNDSLDICLIANPLMKIKLNRQCIQWVWECDTYEYSPISFKYNE